MFTALFMHGSADGQRAALPTTVERRGNGLAGASSWLAAEGIRTLSLRERFDTLAKRADLPAAGNLLIVTVPAATRIGTAETRSLARWSRDGNTLLVLAALADRPAWSVSGPHAAHNDVQLLTG